MKTRAPSKTFLLFDNLFQHFGERFFSLMTLFSFFSNPFHLLCIPVTFLTFFGDRPCRLSLGIQRRPHHSTHQRLICPFLASSTSVSCTPTHIIFASNRRIRLHFQPLISVTSSPHWGAQIPVPLSHFRIIAFVKPYIFALYLFFLFCFLTFSCNPSLR